MGGIKLKNACIFYYGNPAGYVKGSVAIVDPIFKKEELEGWILNNKLTAKWTEGVFERLAKGELVAEDNEVILTLLKRCRIWQLREEVPVEYKFIEYEKYKENFGEPDKNNYKNVYDGEIETNDLETIYAKFNLNHPHGFMGHSLSMSDVIELYDDEGSEFYYVDRFGFKKINFKIVDQIKDMNMNI